MIEAVFVALMQAAAGEPAAVVEQAPACQETPVARGSVYRCMLGGAELLCGSYGMDSRSIQISCPPPDSRGGASVRELMERPASAERLARARTLTCTDRVESLHHRPWRCTLGNKEMRCVEDRDDEDKLVLCARRGYEINRDLDVQRGVERLVEQGRRR